MQTKDETDALADRYLNNQLNEADKAAFEVAMMEDPALLEQVQMLDALKQGLAAEQATLISGPSNNVVPFRTWLRQPLSLAASVLVAVLGVNALYDFSGQSSTTSSAIPVGALVLLEGTRGTDAATFSGAGPYLFQVDAGFGTEADSFALTLREAGSNAVVFSQENLTADNSGWVRLLFDQSLSGDYLVELAWVDTAGTTQQRAYRFSVNNP